MIILIGASASGKTEIAKILRTQGYKKCITTTTRPKRVNEIAGADYYFVTKKEFNDLLLTNSFIEVTGYQNNLYGLQKKDLTVDGLVIVDPNGANAILRVLGKEAFVVLIKSSKKLRKERMLKRKDKMEDIKIRLKKDDKIFKKRNISRVNLVLNNNDESLEKLATIIKQKYQSYKIENLSQWLTEI